MKIGSLYQTKRYSWQLFHSLEIAVTANERLPQTNTIDPLKIAAAYLSGQSNCNYIPLNTAFMLLEQQSEFYKILTTDGLVGWIYLGDWCKEVDVEEVKAG